jgi:hypothetical protein
MPASCAPVAGGRFGSTPLASFKDQAIVDARSGAARPLASLWAAQPVVLLFFRRLGCALCRTAALEYRDAVAAVEARGATAVALAFEALGTGSDADGSFEAGGYWPGPLFTIAADVFDELFGRKTLFSGLYGALDVSRAKIAAAKARGVTGNFIGDGLLLGGAFVVDKGGAVLVDHRSRFFGDDLRVDDILAALEKAAN